MPLTSRNSLLKLTALGRSQTSGQVILPVTLRTQDSSLTYLMRRPLYLQCRIRTVREEDRVASRMNTVTR